MTGKKPTKPPAEAGAWLLRLKAAGGFVGDTEAERRLAAFCADIAEGKQPDPKYLRLIGQALETAVWSSEKTAKRGERVMKMLGIARKQGKALVSAKSQAYAVVDYLVMLDTMPEAEALRAAAAKHNIGERAMRNRIDKHRAKAVELRELDEQFKRFAKMLETRFGSEKET